MDAALTATATQWTPTPSPTYTATVYIAATAEARLAMTQMVIDATNTAAAWTDTPAPTNTPTRTPTPDSLDLARTPVARNADWTPVIEEFDGVEMVLVPAGCFEMGSTEQQISTAYRQCEEVLGP